MPGVVPEFECVGYVKSIECHDEKHAIVRVRFDDEQIVKYVLPLRDGRQVYVGQQVRIKVSFTFDVRHAKGDV